MSREGAEPTHGRRIPGWSAGLLERLTQDRPTVVTRDDLANYLDELGMSRDVDSTVHQLSRLGWIMASTSKGVWRFIPLGERGQTDTYLPLRAWLAREPGAVFALAGEAAAWHLGYLDRRHTGPIRLWIPEHTRTPFGTREHVTTIHLRWGREMRTQVGPTRALLRRKGLDLTRWSAGLPAFGPDALLAQLAIRPASFAPWADIADHINDLADDCTANTVIDLLRDQPPTAWQRAAYLLDVGGATDVAADVLEARGADPLSHVTIGNGSVGVHSARFNVTDRLVVPHLQSAGKA